MSSGDEVVVPTQSQVADYMLDQFMELLRKQPDGEYYFPMFRFSDRTPEVAKLHDVVSKLSVYFPEYTWITADSLDPNVRGLTIRWRRRPGWLSPNEMDKQIGT